MTKSEQAIERAHADALREDARLANRCMYCEGPCRKGSWDVDGQAAHAKCHKGACRD